MRLVPRVQLSGSNGSAQILSASNLVLDSLSDDLS